MPLGPGFYDDECTRIRESSGASVVILLVLGAPHGKNGMSCQCHEDHVLHLPMMLRDIAQQIEASGGGNA